MNNDINLRISNYYNSNPDKQKYIKGVTQSDVPKIVLENGTLKAYATIDELENNTFDWSQIIPQNNISNATETVVTPQPVVQNTAPQPIAQSIEVPNPAPQPVQNISGNTTLNDVKTLFELSVADPESKKTLDSIIKTFADDGQGNVSIEKAITVVQNNSVQLAVDAIMNQKGLPTELYKYTIDGKLNIQDDNYNYTNKDSEIEKAFNNVLIFANGAKVYGINNFTDEVIASAKNAFISIIDNTLASKGYTGEPKEEIKPDNTPQTPPVPETPVVPTPVVPEVTEEKAGFADIFILVLIVAVYAVIIVNLVLKIK